MNRKKRQAAEAKLTAYALLVSRGHRDAYLVDGSCAALGEERVLELIKREQQSVALLRLGTGDVVIVGRVALAQKLTMLQAQGLDAPFLVSADAAPGKDTEPRLLGVDEIGAVTACLLTATAGWHSSSSSVLELELAEVELVERVVGYPFVAGWLLGYPCIYHSTTPGANLLSMQRLVKFSISGALWDEGTTVDLLEFTVPAALLAAEEHNERALRLRAIVQGLITSLEGRQDDVQLRSIQLQEAEFVLPTVSL